MPFLRRHAVAFDAGKIFASRPMHYSDSIADMVSGPIDLAVVHGIAPDADGAVSLACRSILRRGAGRDGYPAMAIVNRNICRAPADTRACRCSRRSRLCEGWIGRWWKLGGTALPRPLLQDRRDDPGWGTDAAAHSASETCSSGMKALVPTRRPGPIAIHSGLVHESGAGLIDAGRRRDEAGCDLTAWDGYAGAYERVAREPALSLSAPLM